IGFAQLAAQSPFGNSGRDAPHESDGFANKVDGAHSRDQDQSSNINAQQQYQRPYGPKSRAEQPAMFVGQTVTDPAARALDVERRVPAAQMIRLHVQQTGARYDKEDNPRKSPGHLQPR